MRGPAPGAAALLLAAILATGGATVAALERARLTLDAVTGQGWSTGPVRISLGFDGRDLNVDAQVEELALPAPLTGLRRARLQCLNAAWRATRIECPAATLTLGTREAVVIRMTAAVGLDTDGRRISVVAREQSLAGGLVSLDMDVRDGSTRARLVLAGLQAGAANELLASLGVTTGVVVTAGTVSGELRLRPGAGLDTAKASLRMQGLSFSDASGLRAAEGLDVGMAVDGRGAGASWTVQVRASMDAGLVYADPLLLDVMDEPVTFEASGQLMAGHRLELSQLALHDPRGADVSGGATIELGGPLRAGALSLRLAPIAAQRLYERYLKAFTGAGALADLLLAGRVWAELDWQAGGDGRASIVLEQVDVGDAKGRFSLLGVNGQVHWGDAAPAKPSWLSWRGAQVHALDFGDGSLRARLQGRDLELTAPLELSVFDGALRLSRLEASDLGGPEQRVEADVVLLPISLRRVSDRLAWLPLAGSISGSFPGVAYTDGRVEVNSDVRIGLFEGTVDVSSLSLEQPFGVVPVLRADLSVRGIDLELMTRALSFGSIEGRLDGDVRGLVLEGWRPVAFDAWLATPEDDRSRHRISQRAVDNLASLGGVSAVLSSTFLRFFKEFSYDRLGLSCRLDAGVCEMGGVAPASEGYYIIKGGGLPPRIDVVGFNARVDWNTMVERLKAVASAEGPMVR